MTDADPNCDFCAIAVGRPEADIEVVCEAERWVAFFPLSPATPGHTLLIPRRHVADLGEAGTDLAEELARGVLRVGQAIYESLDPEGMNLITSAGSAAEQTIFHLHLHVVPRWHRDGFGSIWPPKHRYRDQQLQQLASRIREACEDIP